MPSKPSKPGAAKSASSSLVPVGRRDVVQQKPSKKHTNRDEHGRYPTTSKALILRDQRNTLSGGSASAQRITGREKLDLLAEDLVEQSKTALSEPFRIEKLQKLAVSQYDLSLDAIAELRDPEVFHLIVQPECVARVENVPVDTRQAAVYITGFLKNPSYVAQTVNIMVHNRYTVASAWQIIYSTLEELQKEYGLSDATIKSQLASSERIRSRYLALYELTEQLVDAAQANFSNLTKNNAHYAAYFKPSDFHNAKKTDIMFDVDKLKDTGRNFVDSIIMEICFPNSVYPKSVLLRILRDAVKECPRESKRFPQALWDAMSAFSIAVEFKEIMEAAFFGPEGEKIKQMSFEQPTDYEQWLDAQFYSLEATKMIDFKDLLKPLDRTKQPEVLESIWKSINQNYIAVSGESVDDLWGLEGALERAPQWNSYFMPTLDAQNQGKGRAIGGGKKRLAITQSGGGFESDDSMPGLQSVSNSSDDEESDYDDSDDDDESDAESEDSGYYTDHEDQLRDLFREAMEMHQEWGFQDREGIQMDSDNSREDKNPFLKLLSSLRGRMFQSEPKMQTKAAPAAPKTKKGFFNRTAPTRKAANYAPAPAGFKEPAAPKAPPKAPGPAATAPRGVTIEEVDDEDDDQEVSKKKKKKKPKKKKKKTGGQTEEQPILERVATPPPSSPPPPSTPSKKTKAAKPPKAPTSPPTTNVNASAQFLPLETSTTAQSAHSYLKEVESQMPKQKVKTRSETGSIMEPEEKKPTAFKKFVNRLGFGKKTTDEGQVKAKRSWFAALNRKGLAVAEKLMKTAKESGKSSIKWEEFEQFMKKMGFEVDPSTAGSSVRFDPPNKTDRSITFHKPHPDSTIDHIHVHLFGKKLREYYGWDEEDLKGLSG